MSFIDATQKGKRRKGTSTCLLEPSISIGCQADCLCRNGRAQMFTQMPPIRFMFWQENSLKSVSLTEEVTYLSSHRRGQVSWIKLRSLKCFSLAELCPPALHFMENFLGPPLDQSRRNVLWPLMRQMYLTVNSWAPAPAECLRTVEDRLQSCQAQILKRLVPFPLHGQTRMQINHLTELVISLMGFHPWLCRLSPPPTPREVVGRVHLFIDRQNIPAAVR